MDSSFRQNTLVIDYKTMKNILRKMCKNKTNIHTHIVDERKQKAKKSNRQKKIKTQRIPVEGPEK